MRIKNEVMDILNFFNNLTLYEVILYFISGYIFTFVFCFVSDVKRDNGYQNMLFRSLISGYILTQFYYIVPSVTKNEKIDILIFVIFCVIGAYVSARVIKSNRFWLFLRRLKIYNTVNNGIWLDIIDDRCPTWIRATIKSQNEDIWGQVDTVELHNRKPLILLSDYEICDLDGNIIKDLKDDTTRKILVDTEKCDRLEVVYNEKSQKTRNYDFKS